MGHFSPGPLSGEKPAETIHHAADKCRVIRLHAQDHNAWQATIVSRDSEALSHHPERGVPELVRICGRMFEEFLQ